MGSLRKNCKTIGCHNLHTNRSGYCDECQARWRAAHPDQAYEKARGSSSARGYGWKWRRFAKDYLTRHPVCAICGQPATCVDHKDMTADMMLDAYGAFDYDESHYQALCASCNARKGAREDRMMRQDYIDGLRRLSDPGEGSEKSAPTPSTGCAKPLPHTEDF